MGAAARRGRIRAVRARTPRQAVRPSPGADGHRNHQRAEHHHLLADDECDRTLQGGRPGARRRHRPDRLRLAQGLLRHRLPPSARRRQGRAAGGQGRGVPRRLRHRAVEGLHARVRWQACAGIRERGPRHPPVPHDRRNDGLPADRGKATTTSCETPTRR